MGYYKSSQGKPPMQTYLTKEQRKSVIAQMVDCSIEVGDILEEDAHVYEEHLKSLSNTELIQQVKDTGWDIAWQHRFILLHL